MGDGRLPLAARRDTPAGAQDDRAVDRLAQDGVRAAHIVRVGRSDCGRLHAQTRSGPSLSARFFHSLVLGGAPFFQAEVEVLEV